MSYDLQEDPGEKHNLINDPAHADTVQKLNKRLFELLKETKGTEMPILEDRGTKFLHRKKEGAPGAKFPNWFYRAPDDSWQPKQ